MFQETICHGRTRRALAGLCRAAGLGGVHRGGPCGVGPAVRAPGRAARQPRGRALPRRDRSARLSHPGVPDVEGLNAILEPRTGWRTVAVPGLVPDDIFFAMLSERVFPVGNFIRTREQLDYLEAPDCFHDMFGHIPMLAHHDYARDDPARRRAWHRRDRRRRGRAGGAALLAQRRIRAGARSMAS